MQESTINDPLSCCLESKTTGQGIELKCGHWMCYSCVLSRLDKKENRMRTFKIAKCLSCATTTILKNDVIKEVRERVKEENNIPIDKSVKEKEIRQEDRAVSSEKKDDSNSNHTSSQSSINTPKGDLANPFHVCDYSSTTVVDNTSVSEVESRISKVSKRQKSKQKSGKLIKNISRTGSVKKQFKKSDKSSKLASQLQNITINPLDHTTKLIEDFNLNNKEGLDKLFLKHAIKTKNQSKAEKPIQEPNESDKLEQMEKEINDPRLCGRQSPQILPFPILQKMPSSFRGS